MALTKIPGNLIETGAVTGDVLADGGIATAKLADNAVTTVKITDANITHAKLHTSMDLTGKTVTVATAAGSTNTTAAASTAFVQQELTTLIGGAPGTLDTLNELAAAINDDDDYHTTLTTALATKLPLAGGTLTGNADFGNNLATRYGGSQQLQIYHNGTRGYITNTSGALWLQTSDFRVYKGDGSERMIQADDDGAVILYHDGNSKLATTSTGIDVTGAISSGDVNITSAAPTIFFTDSDGTNQNTTVKQSGGNFFVIARDNTANAGIVFAGNASGTYDEYARFKADGNFGIGTNNPAFKFVVAHNGRNGMEFVPNTDDAGTNIIQNYNRGTAAYTPLRIAGNSLTLLSGTNAQYSTAIDTSGNIATSGNISLTGGGTIEAPSVGGGEPLILKAAGGITAIIDSNGNGGDDQFFKVQKHTGDNLLTVQETGAVEVVGTLNSGGNLSTTASVGVNHFFKSTYNYGPNRDWAIRTNNYGSSNWGGWSLEQSGEQQGTPDIARIGVHANGNVGIKMGGGASSGLTSINPATALHVGGDITVGSADAVGTNGTASIRFQNDNERSRITSNYASGGGGEMGFWTDTTGGSLLNRAYIKNDGSFNLNGNLKLHSNYWASNDVMKTYSIVGPSTTSLTRTINVNTYWNFAAQGGAFMYMLHGWQGDSAMGMVHWSNAGNNTQVIVGVYHNELVKTGLTSITVAKGSGAYDIDITLAGTHTNTHGWYWKVWA